LNSRNFINRQLGLSPRSLFQRFRECLGVSLEAWQGRCLWSYAAERQDVGLEVLEGFFNRGGADQGGISHILIYRGFF
jgi:hypothetical protein